MKRKKSVIGRRRLVVEFLRLVIGVREIVRPYVTEIIIVLGINLLTTDVKIDGRIIKKVGCDVRVTRTDRLEPETIQDITQDWNGDGRILIGDGLDKLRDLRKVRVTGKLHAEE